ncbi:Target of Myb protein 1 [Rhynchospora pubera]|uniref:Target of Myb protein 1 n=1 Tax=Rhynchospora pubera TaxID=906938 RepID=A0AAV8F6S6_9POAL|nr:Target of Myb protein 1 [Rhynchospora pubera]KAJ4788809.1 Target of Myb protein 1 [Rhynchospora pubera]
MGNDLVDRATSDTLIGPDLTLNLEICDIVNQDMRRAKDVVKALKKRISHKNAKVQILALSLLESLIKNCGEPVHAYVAEKDVLKEMVKVAKKKTLDGRVKQKLLSLIDIWQEAFGGPLGKHPQYYAAYQDLLRAGFLFPERTEGSEAIFTPAQTQPLQNHPASVRTEHHDRELPASTQPEETLMSITEINNALSIVDVLTEMLNAIEPAKKGLQAVGQEVIVELVEQCRTNKERVVKLVDSTTDEYILSKALALHDNLQKVLAQHDAIAAGLTVRDKPLPPPILDNNSAKQGTSKEPDSNSSGPSTSKDEKPAPQVLALPAPPPKSTATPPAPVKAEPLIDLLSGDDYYKPESDQNPMALVPYDPNITAADQNVLALADMFADLDSGNHNSNQHSNNYGPTSQANRNPQRRLSAEPTFRANRNVPPQHMQQARHRNVEPTFHANGNDPNPMALTLYDPKSQQNNASNQWNGVNNQNGSLPPAPWEAVSTNPFQDNQMSLQTNYPTQQMQSYPIQQLQAYPAQQPPPMQVAQPGYLTVVPQPVIIGQVGTLQPMGTPAYSPYSQIQIMPIANQQTMYAGQMPQLYVQNTYAYGYGNVYGASMQENVSLYNQSSTTVVQQSTNQSKPKDNMFGDLVNMTKYKKSMNKKIGAL